MHGLCTVLPVIHNEIALVCVCVIYSGTSGAYCFVYIPGMFKLRMKNTHVDDVCQYVLIEINGIHHNQKSHILLFDRA